MRKNMRDMKIQDIVENIKYVQIGKDLELFK